MDTLSGTTARPMSLWLDGIWASSTRLDDLLKGSIYSIWGDTKSFQYQDPLTYDLFSSLDIFGRSTVSTNSWFRTEWREEDEDK